MFAAKVPFTIKHHTDTAKAIIMSIHPNADGSQWVQPSQVAAILLHLASDDGAQITGAAIPVYGKQV